MQRVELVYFTFGTESWFLICEDFGSCRGTQNVVLDCVLFQLVKHLQAPSSGSEGRWWTDAQRRQCILGKLAGLDFLMRQEPAAGFFSAYKQLVYLFSLISRRFGQRHLGFLLPNRRLETKVSHRGFHYHYCHQEKFESSQSYYEDEIVEFISSSGCGNGDDVGTEETR
ncbi:hypothetical protein HAX54_051766 [Datura stramonium]|uniref:Uncharacterized protein n=1 Tax=Datura stramonium TaxID=4076 RepID=A0ABS8SYY2_DATST|nr:hypothetical protein [Datura stramonium]